MHQSRKKKGSAALGVESKNQVLYLSQKGNNIVGKWIREVSERPPLQRF